jgi:hypothetical protein
MDWRLIWLDDCWMIGFIFREHEVVYIADPSITGEASLDASVLCVRSWGRRGVIAVDDNIFFILSLDELSYCITTTCREHSNPVRVT